MNRNFSPSLFDGTMYEPPRETKVVNVASVPNRSPFRYPGGKTWLVPTIRKWLSSDTPKNLIEPFCGGGTVSLTAVAEGLAETVLMIEKDADVASVWRVILEDEEWLVNEILSFRMGTEQVLSVTGTNPVNDRERAFQTIIRNRTNHGGILAQGSGIVKYGEKGKGIASRWYPRTLARRIRDIAANKSKIRFIEGDAFDYLDANVYNENTYYFIDPPYTVAGRRLYSLSNISHELLFEKVSRLKCHYLMTYDHSDYVVALAEKFGMQYFTIPMQTTHLVKKNELLISNDFSWL